MDVVTEDHVGLIALAGFLPVIVFLLTLRYLDSFKLVHWKLLVSVIAGGGGLAVVCYFVNDLLLSVTGVQLVTYSRYIAPLVEETAKALLICYLFRLHRIGFLVDAAILGFATGAGFALVENLVYWGMGLTDSTGVWLVRGFGTAIMHGGVTALFAVIAEGLTERASSIRLLDYLPGFGLAVLLHAGFNHFFLSPMLSALLTIMVVPPLLYFTFQRGVTSMHGWLEHDFDNDTWMLQQLASGEFRDTNSGRYLLNLREHFDPMVIVDMLCYLRVHTELALSAKGMLLMRENGFDMPLDETAKDKITELRYLEESIGQTGMLALRPLLAETRKDIWQLYMLE